MKKQGIMFCIIIMGMLMVCGCAVSKKQLEHIDEELNHWKQDKQQVENLKSLQITASYADVSIVASDQYYVEYSYYYKQNEPKFSIEDGVLILDDSDTVIDNINFNDKVENYIKIYVPTEGTFESVSIETQSAETTLNGFFAETVNVTNRYGTIDIGNSVIKTLTLEGDSAEINLENLKLNDVTMNDLYGDFNFRDSSADQLVSSMNSGDFRLENCNIKQIVADNIYGNISMEIPALEAQYGLELKSTYGMININQKEYETSFVKDSNTDYKMIVNTKSGDIIVSFVPKGESCEKSALRLIFYTANCF